MLVLIRAPLNIAGLGTLGSSPWARIAGHSPLGSSVSRRWARTKRTARRSQAARVRTIALPPRSLLLAGKGASLLLEAPHSAFLALEILLELLDLHG
eukprot:14056078-Alexandrium_andersonii.AAC.1